MTPNTPAPADTALGPTQEAPQGSTTIIVVLILQYCLWVRALFKSGEFTGNGGCPYVLVKRRVDGLLDKGCRRGACEQDVAASASQGDEGLVVAFALGDLPVVVGPRDRIPEGCEC